nr:MAG TPA: hypothetical protein [Caudoviricetes sp.]
MFRARVNYGPFAFRRHIPINIVGCSGSSTRPACLALLVQTDSPQSPSRYASHAFRPQDTYSICWRLAWLRTAFNWLGGMAYCLCLHRARTQQKLCLTSTYNCAMLALRK